MTPHQSAILPYVSTIAAYGWIFIQGHQIPYRISKGKFGYTKISFSGGLMRISTQSGTIEAIDQSLIDSKSEWIIGAYLRGADVWETQKVLLDNQNKMTLYNGKFYHWEFKIGKRYDVLVEDPTLFQSNQNKITVITTQRTFNTATPQELAYTAMVHLAKALIFEKLPIWASKMNVSYNSIFVKNQRSKWGSCSSNKNLNFNWRIAMLDPLVMDYLMVHELAHLVHMNHSKKFWELVEGFIPDYLQHDAVLKKQSWLITLYDV